MKTLFLMLLFAALVSWLCSSRLVLVFLFAFCASVAPVVIWICIEESNRSVK